MTIAPPLLTSSYWLKIKTKVTQPPWLLIRGKSSPANTYRIITKAVNPLYEHVPTPLIQSAINR